MKKKYIVKLTLNQIEDDESDEILDEIPLIEEESLEEAQNKLERIGDMIMSVELF